MMFPSRRGRGRRAADQHGRGGERGFVLLMVLGLVALLALFGSRLAHQARTEAGLAAAWRAGAAVEAAADSAIHAAAMRLLKGDGTIGAAPGPIRIEAIPVWVRVTDEAARINPNYANAPMLRALFLGAGLDAGAARAIADAIVDWRQPSPRARGGGLKRTLYETGGLSYAPSNRMFDSLDELRLVLGMTPEIFAVVRPLLSIHTIGDVRLQGASPAVIAAVAAARELDPLAGKLGFENPDRVVRIRAEAAAGGARFTREAVVRFKARPRADEAPLQILTWEEGTE